MRERVLQQRLVALMLQELISMLWLQLKQGNRKQGSTPHGVKRSLGDWQVQARASTKEMHPIKSMLLHQIEDRACFYSII